MPHQDLIADVPKDVRDIGNIQSAIDYQQFLPMVLFINGVFNWKTFWCWWKYFRQSKFYLILIRKGQVDLPILLYKMLGSEKELKLAFILDSIYLEKLNVNVNEYIFKLDILVSKID